MLEDMISQGFIIIEGGSSCTPQSTTKSNSSFRYYIQSHLISLLMTLLCSQILRRVFALDEKIILSFLH